MGGDGGAKDDVAADTGSPGDIDSRGPGDSAPAETGDTEDTGDTAGADDQLYVPVYHRDTPYTVSCDAASGEDFVRTYDDALGNVAGRVSCTSPAGTLSLTFTAGAEGEWTDPSAGVDFGWTGPDGQRLGYYEPDLVVSDWGVQFRRFERLDTRTIALDASVAGTWLDVDGNHVGSISGSTSATLSCTNCP